MIMIFLAAVEEDVFPHTIIFAIIIPSSFSLDIILIIIAESPVDYFKQGF